MDLNPPDPGDIDPNFSVEVAAIREAVELAVALELRRKREANEPIVIFRDGEVQTLLPGDEGYYGEASPFDGL